MPTLKAYKGEAYLWHYVPSMPAAISFTIIFGLITAIHGYKMVRTRLWFCAPFFVGGIFEVIGYMTRAAATNATDSLVLYLLQSIFLLLPPILFAASQYMVYSRVVRAVQGDRFSLISPRWSSRIFIIGDWLCLNVQSSGASLLSKPKNVKIGNYIIVSGLILQVLMFVGFMFCCLTFHIKFRTYLTNSGAAIDVPWKACLHMLYWTSLAVLVRNMFRVVEFCMGQDSYLFNNEWPTYVFDGALMLLVMIGFYIWYPSQLHPESTDSVIELMSTVNNATENDRSKDSESTPSNSHPR